MSSVWTKNNDNQWQSQQIAFDTAALVKLGLLYLVQIGKGSDREVVMLLRQIEAGWVNGGPVIAGLKVLEHQDEILIGNQTWYYSAESTPVRVEFQLPEGERRPRCALCRSAIEDTQAAVACPRCGRWFHQLDAIDDRPEKKCWTYNDRCLCQHPTSLSGEPVWRPDQEDDCA